MREEGETLAYRESAASFTCNVYRFLLEINVMDFDSLYLGSTQSTGGAEGKDAQVPAMKVREISTNTRGIDIADSRYLCLLHPTHKELEMCIGVPDCFVGGDVSFIKQLF